MNGGTGTRNGKRDNGREGASNPRKCTFKAPPKDPRQEGTSRKASSVR